jgi:hypothetical protein
VLTQRRLLKESAIQQAMFLARERACVQVLQILCNYVEKTADLL